MAPRGTEEVEHGGAHAPAWAVILGAAAASAFSAGAVVLLLHTADPRAAVGDATTTAAVSSVDPSRATLGRPAALAEEARSAAETPRPSASDEVPNATPPLRSSAEGTAETPQTATPRGDVPHREASDTLGPDAPWFFFPARGASSAQLVPAVDTQANDAREKVLAAEHARGNERTSAEAERAAAEAERWAAKPPPRPDPRTLYAPSMSAGAGAFSTQPLPWASSAFRSNPNAGAGAFLTTPASPWLASGLTSNPSAGAGAFTTEWPTYFEPWPLPSSLVPPPSEEESSP